MENFEPIPNNNYAKNNPAFNDKISNFGNSEISGTVPAFSNVPYLTANFSIFCYANQVKATNLDAKNGGVKPPEREEFDIKEFTHNSRMRLFSLITSLDYKSYGKPIFVSATFHEDMPDTQRSIKTHLDNFHKRLKRNLPPFHIIWKLEYQKRGAPHFHFILFPLDQSKDFSEEKIFKTIHSNWIELKKCKCKHCNLYSIVSKPLNDFVHIMIYISKELGKITQNEQKHDLGRVWGSSRNMKIVIFKKIEMPFKFYSRILQEICDNNKIHPNLETYIQSIRMFGFSSKLFIPFELIQPYLIKYEKQNQQPIIKMKSITMHRYNFRKENSTNGTT
jgi:hypothetical protein